MPRPPSSLGLVVRNRTLTLIEREDLGLVVRNRTLTLIEREDLGLVVRNRTLTLIDREDDTRSWGNFLVYFSHNDMST
jgi:hypothetical protein